MKEIIKNLKFSTKDMTFIGIMIAVLAVASQISIPMPIGVPITLQTMVIAIIGGLLSVRNSFIAVLLYLIIGIIGVPVFANFSSGLGVLFGATGGFLYGFLIIAPFIAFLTKVININDKDKNIKKMTYLYYFIIFFTISTVLILVIGSFQMALILNLTFKDTVLALIVYLPGGIIKSIAATVIVIKLKKYELE